VKRYIIKLLVKISTFDFLIAAIQQLGWDVAVPKETDDDENELINGLIIGRTEYVERIIDTLDGEMILKREYDNDSN
jgi:hypothetical protein